MQIAISQGVPGILGDCGGVCSCATCHGYLDAACSDRLPARTETEQFMLDGVPALRGARAGRHPRPVARRAGLTPISTSTSHPITVARSFLFLLTDRLERLTKALVINAHEVIFNMEDAVSLEAKAAVRSHLLWRINAAAGEASRATSTAHGAR